MREKLLELGQENEDVAACNQAALEGALMLDRVEDTVARLRMPTQMSSFLT